MAVIKTDVLVIGGGGAAARAALEASLAGAHVTMLIKGRLGHSGSTVFPVALHGTFSAFTGGNPHDSVDRHFEDTMEAAQGMCSPKLARIIAEEAPNAVRDLERFGVPFLKDDKGNYQAWVGCFATHARSHRIVGHGEPILAALKKQISKRDIQIHEKQFVERLLVQNGRCVGAVAFGPDGMPVIYSAKATILGTGGAGQLFKANINPKGITGDGYVMAYQAGADLVNMEFMQTGIAIIHPLTLLSAWIWGYQPALRNSRGEQFLGHYLPSGVSTDEVYAAKAGHFPFSSSDVSKYLEISVLKEMRAGREVYFDLTRSPRLGEFKTTEMYAWLVKRGLDVETTPAEISVYAQAVNGGVLIDEYGASTLPGLYAAGEVAGGAHGADRLGGAMLSNSQVFGARAGRHAAHYARDCIQHDVDFSELEHSADRARLVGDEALGEALSDMREQIRKLMFDTLLIEREGEKLVAALEWLEDDSRFQHLADQRGVRGSWAAMEVSSLRQIGRLMLTAALLRQESRGSHYRSDFPRRDDALWERSTVLRRGQEGRIEHELVSL